MLSPEDIIIAHKRIKNYLHTTPIYKSSILNQMLGNHNIYFKMECFQKIGAFKARGAFNKIIHLIEKNKKPDHIVAVSSGNHAQGIALACKTFDIKATIFMNKSVSPLKIKATKSYGAEVILVNSNQEADQKATEAEKNGAYFIHPFDDDQIIAGQGTVAYEALLELNEVNIDAIFAPCGGGGLLSGSLLASKIFKHKIEIIGGEPANCNDAAISLKNDKLHIFEDLPPSIADAIRTLSISEKTFLHLKNISEIIEISEDEIIYWTQWLQHLLKATAEPCSGVAMSAAHKWLEKQTKQKNILVIISGGNISQETYKEIWKNNYLDLEPKIN
jgi:threonine dehydratase